MSSVSRRDFVKFMGWTAAGLAASQWPSLAGADEIIAREGKGYLERINGNLVLHVAGSPREMGWQHGVLLRPHVRDNVNNTLYVEGFAATVATGEPFLGRIQKAWRELQPHIPPAYITEMNALAAGAGMQAREIHYANVFPELFHCTGFALMGKATKNGVLYHGRNLDYFTNIGLEKNAVVIVYRPDYGYAWVNIGYAGFIGTVTAMNEKQIAMGEIGGKNNEKWNGMPMADLMRYVMEHAATLDEAVDIVRRTPRTCSYHYVISDGKSNRAVAIYATPSVFETAGPGQYNLELQPTPVADTVMVSSGEHYKKLVERVKRNYGRIDAKIAIALMKRPVAFQQNLQSVLFVPHTLDFWAANARGQSPACDQPYTHYNLVELLHQRVPIANRTRRPAGRAAVRTRGGRSAQAAGMTTSGQALIYSASDASPRRRPQS